MINQEQKANLLSKYNLTVTANDDKYDIFADLSAPALTEAELKIEIKSKIDTVKASIIKNSEMPFKPTLDRLVQELDELTQLQHSVNNYGV